MAAPGSLAAQGAPLPDDAAVGLDLLAMSIGADIPQEALKKLSIGEPDVSTEFQVKTGMVDDGS